jgi:hypothetical protein
VGSSDRLLDRALLFVPSRHHTLQGVSLLVSNFYGAVSGWTFSFSAWTASASFPLRQLMKMEKAK